MDEMISRAAAIEAIEKHIRTAEEPYQLTDADKVMNHAFEIAASCVYNLSAAEAEVRTQMPSADCISRYGVSAWLSNMLYPKPSDILMDKNRFPFAQLKSYREGYQAGFNEGYQAGFKDAQSETAAQICEVNRNEMQ